MQHMLIFIKLEHRKEIRNKNFSLTLLKKQNEKYPATETGEGKRERRSLTNY